MIFALFIIFVELIAYLFIGLTLYDFLLVFGFSYGVIFFTLCLICLLKSDKEEKEKKINPFGVYSTK